MKRKISEFFLPTPKRRRKGKRCFIHGHNTSVSFHFQNGDEKIRSCELFFRENWINYPKIKEKCLSPIFVTHHPEHPFSLFSEI